MAFLQDFHNKYSGEHGVILTCGPSLNVYDEDTLKRKLNDKVVIAVKQAIYKYPDSRFHMWNCCNLPVPTDGVHYNYDEMGTYPTVIASSNFHRGSKWSIKQDIDHFCKIPNPSRDGWEFVTKTLDFDRWTFENSPKKRPCGPGIMYETVLFWAVHLGFSKLTVMGWDLGSQANHEHFYRSRVHNKGFILPWEIEVTRNAAVPLYYWMRDRGIKLQLDSPLSAIDEVIPRIEL